jgi:hypothetical protein
MSMEGADGAKGTSQIAVSAQQTLEILGPIDKKMGGRHMPSTHERRQLTA